VNLDFVMVRVISWIVHSVKVVAKKKICERKNMINRCHFSRLFLLAFVLATIMQGSVRALGQAVAPLNDPAIEARVSSLLQQMTLEEKLGQLNQFSAGQPTGPGTGRSEYGRMIAAGQIGSLLNLTGAKETN
jgi:hypothetical protein